MQEIDEECQEISYRLMDAVGSLRLAVRALEDLEERISDACRTNGPEEHEGDEIVPDTTTSEPN